MLSGDESIPFWQYLLEKGLATQSQGGHTHLITCFHAIPLMLEGDGALIVEVTGGNRLTYNGVGVYYSLSKTSVILLAYLMSEELRDHGVAVVSLTPGWLRSERMLDGFGVSEGNWRDAIAEHPGFEKSETPLYAGHAVVAVESDPQAASPPGPPQGIGADKGRGPPQAPSLLRNRPSRQGMSSQTTVQVRAHRAR